MIDNVQPSRKWINEIRPVGVATYGEKQWSDWEFLIQTMAVFFNWEHPSVCNPGDYVWVIGNFDSYSGYHSVPYKMNVIDWSIIDQRGNYPRFKHLINRRLAVYMILMV